MIFNIFIVCVISLVNCAKITLFDSTKQRDDLNWSKISFKETSNNPHTNSNWIQEKLNSKSDLHGWKESSFSSSGGDDVWRIHFVCDLNVQNIQNWLFTPLINTKTANRVTLNLTFTIRECENLPVKQVKNCREKFELYFEESQTSEEKFFGLEQDFVGINEQNRSNVYFLNKIKQLKFRDTFVSDTGLRYYNSVVDRQKQKNNSNRPGESSINVELREIPLTGIQPTFVRFAIRDTGACISLLSVELSYLTCPALYKHGIYFPETPTGRDLTDLVQVNGKCPENSISTQQPKAICTAKGEWLITDSNLSSKCLCSSGYESINDKCAECPIGYFKSSVGNDQKCEVCPQNSWSSQPGSDKCECLKGFYKEDENDFKTPCRQITQITPKFINFEFVNDEKINVTVNRQDQSLKNSKIQIDIKCFQCDSMNGYALNKCEINCFTLSTSNDYVLILNRNLNQISRLKLVFKQKIIDREIAQNVLFINLKQEKHRILDEKFSCEYQNDFKNFCLNMSVNMNFELENMFSRNDLIGKIRGNRLLKSSIFALQINNDYQLIPSDYNFHLQPSNVKTSYIKIPSHDMLNNILDKNFSTPLVYCNSNQIDKVKFQFEFDVSSDIGFVKNNIEIYTIDYKISDVCFLKEKEKKIDSDLILTNNALLRLTEQINNVEQIQPNETNLKIHVILPIILSFVLVFCLFVLAIFVRKFKYCTDRKNDEGNFNKFINKKCSSQCNSCSSTNTSCSSSTSSSTPSTICTTSQIIERESKLYYVDPHTYEDPTLAVQEFAQEISPLDIKIESVIGGGEFGDVCKGKLKSSSNWITVAIKTLKVGSSEKNRCDFLTEASIMAQFHHENIICLEGVVTQSHPFMIITEYMDNGSLDTFLRLNSWRLNIYDLIKMLRDISNGMKYLSEMNFVHRDLAARNILVDKDLKCKVADFGLSREIEGTNTEGVYWTKGGKIPVRWTAPEAITHTKFTCSSDVWSYGVVMWEVMSFGERPYWNWSNTDVIKAVDKGFRLFIPPNCPQVLYNIMLDCWEADRLKRPKFKKLVCDLDLLIKSKKECLYVPTKNSKQNSNIDTNRPNFTHLTSVHEWLNSLNLIEYTSIFVNRRLANLSQVLQIELEDLIKMEIFDQNHQMIMLDSLKRIQFELNFQNGFLV